MKVAIGCDHIVTDVKEQVKRYLKNKGFEIVDCGTHGYERTHYPIYGKKVADKVVTGECNYGVVMCGTGVGIANAAQKVKGARCALVGDVMTAKYAREKLDCNIIGIGGRISGIGMIEDIMDAFFDTQYHSSQKNDEVVRKIDSLISRTDYIGDEHFFDEYLIKWERGEYHD